MTKKSSFLKQILHLLFSHGHSTYKMGFLQFKAKPYSRKLSLVLFLLNMVRESQILQKYGWAEDL